VLRGCAVVAGVLLSVAGIVLLVVVRVAWPAGVELLVSGAVVVASVLFERRYRTRVRTGSEWQLTGERFIDPSTGKLMQVRYNPQTGERSYEESGSKNTPI
jgi:hypothetical protein